MTNMLIITNSCFEILNFKCAKIMFIRSDILTRMRIAFKISNKTKKENDVKNDQILTTWASCPEKNFRFCFDYLFVFV